MHYNNAHRYEHIMSEHPTATVSGMFLEGFSNGPAQRRPRVLVRVTLGADVVNFGRGVSGTADVRYYYRGDRWERDPGFCTYVRSDGRELTPRMVEMLRDACDAMVPAAPTRDEVVALLRLAADCERIDAAEDYRKRCERIDADLARGLTDYLDGVEPIAFAR